MSLATNLPLTRGKRFLFFHSQRFFEPILDKKAERYRQQNLTFCNLVDEKMDLQQTEMPKCQTLNVVQKGMMKRRTNHRTYYADKIDTIRIYIILGYVVRNVYTVEAARLKQIHTNLK
jgi:hypothetical protein